MSFTIGAAIAFISVVVFAIWSVTRLVDDDKVGSSVLIVVSVVLAVAGSWLQTHRIVATQHIGISRDTFSQKLYGPYHPGVVPKPFFGSVYEYPASSSLERCEQYTPAIKGSYGIALDLCFYYDANNVDWLKEINRTGSLDANYIMTVWRNSVVSDVARSVKDYTPEALSDNRSDVERAIFENVGGWFNERGVPLVRVSFKNWDFTSSEVAKSFDASIVSQRKITEQTALFEASKISRERELYEAETSKQVAEKQKESLGLLGLEGDAAVQYLWIKMLSENNRVPDVLILGTSSVPISIPIQNPTKTITNTK